MSNYIDSIQLSGTVYTIQGTGGGGSPTVELTQAEYDALVSAGTVSANTYYIITDAQEGDLTQYWTSAQTNSAINAAVSGKQDTLISGTNIKTINNESILGSGNIDVHGDWNENSSGSTSYIKNRPFYMEASSSSECALACVPLSDEAWDNNYGCVNTYTIQTTRIFTEGEKLGLSYIYENQYDCEHPQVSPQTIVNNGGVLTVGPYEHWTLSSNDGVNWTVTYSGDFCIQPVIFWKPTIVTYHKLDSNFIDSDIARTSAVTVEISAAVSGKVDTSAITSSVTSASTDSEIPTAKAVYDAIPTGGTGGGSSFDENFNVPQFANYDNEVQYKYFNTLDSYTCYVKIIDLSSECVINFYDETSGEQLQYSLYGSGSTITATTSTGEIIPNSFSFERVDEFDGMIKITQTANTSNNIYFYIQYNGEAYKIGYTIPSGTTEDAIKTSAYESMNSPLKSMGGLIKGIGSMYVQDQRLRIALDKKDSSQTYNDVCLVNDQEIIYTDENNTTPDNKGLSIKKIVKNAQSWSVVGVSNSGSWINVFYFPSVSYGYTKIRFYLNSGYTIDDGSEFQIAYTNDNGGRNESAFVYNSSNDEFTTEDSNFNVTKTNEYIEVDYVGSTTNGNFRFDHYTSWTIELNENKITMVEVYGNKLMNLQGAYDDLYANKQDTLSAGTGISIVDNVISATGGGGGGMSSGEVQTMIDESISGKVDTSAITSSVTSASTDSEIPTAKAVWEAASGGGSSITVDPSLDSGSTNPVANSAITNNTLSGGVETSNFFRSVRFRRNNGEVAFYKRFAAINGNSVMVDGTTEAPNFQLVETSAITTSVTSASTDAQVPSAKAVYDIIGNINTILESI